MHATVGMDCQSLHLYASTVIYVDVGTASLSVLTWSCFVPPGGFLSGSLFSCSFLFDSQGAPLMRFWFLTHPLLQRYVECPATLPTVEPCSDAA